MVKWRREEERREFMVACFGGCCSRGCGLLAGAWLLALFGSEWEQVKSRF